MQFKSKKDVFCCETAKLDTLTAEAQRAIELLQERRTALISAAVTGQIDVRRHTGAGRYPVNEKYPRSGTSWFCPLRGVVVFAGYRPVSQHGVTYAPV